MATDARNVDLQTRAHHRILELDRSRNPKHVEFPLGELVYIWRSNLDHVVTGTGLDQLTDVAKVEKLLMAFGEICWTKTSQLLKRWKEKRETS